MSQSNETQTELLRNIWNEMKALGVNLGARIDQTNTRLDVVITRLDDTVSRLDDTVSRLDDTVSRLDDTNLRLDNTILRLDSFYGEFVDFRGEVRDGFRTVDRRFDQLLRGEHGREHAWFRRRLDRIEDHVGLPREDG